MHLHVHEILSSNPNPINHAVIIIIESPLIKRREGIIIIDGSHLCIFVCMSGNTLAVIATHHVWQERLTQTSFKHGKNRLHR